MPNEQQILLFDAPSSGETNRALPVKQKSKAAPRSGAARKKKPAKMKWSHSAHKTLRRCQTQFLLGNIMAHHSARDEIRHQAHLLKQIKNYALWRGTLVEDAIELWVVPALQSGQFMPLSELLENAFALMDEQIDFSKWQRYLEPDMSKAQAGKAYLVLDIHERGEEISADELDWMRAEVTLALTNLYGLTDFLEELCSHDSYQARERFSFAMDEFNIGGEFDLIIRKRNSQTLIVDWKVTQSLTSDHSDQMKLYALAAYRSRFAGRAEDIEIKEVRLREPEIISYRATPETLTETENYVFASAHQMKQLTQGLGAAQQEFEDYDLADKPGTCALCSFRPLCREIHASATD